MHPGDPVTRRCLSCETLVSTQAFHQKDKLTTFLVGESVLGWPKAHAALKKVLPSHEPLPLMHGNARRQADRMM